MFLLLKVGSSCDMRLGLFPGLLSRIKSLVGRDLRFPVCY